MLTNTQLQMYNTLVRNIYKSASFQELQSNVLYSLPALVPYHGAAFFLVDPKTLEISEPFLCGFDSAGFTPCSSCYLYGNNKESVFYRKTFPGINQDPDYISNGPKELNEDRFDFLHRQGIHYMACMPVFHQELLSGELSLYRSQEQDDFNEEEMLILNLLSEHINERFSCFDTLLHMPHNPFINEEWGLTKREAQIASLISIGKTNKQIALELGVSENTVKTFLKRLFNKLGVKCRSELICLLYKLNYVR